MKLYVVVKQTEDGLTYNVGGHGGQNRTVRAYMSGAVASNYARLKGGKVLEFDTETGVVVSDYTNVNNT